MLGHSDIALTLNTYSHVLPDMQKGAAEKLDELLFSSGTAGFSVTSGDAAAENIGTTI
jgi:phage major head subunit gpT-like protein